MDVVKGGHKVFAAAGKVERDKLQVWCSRDY
jgi:hypothetical protein